MQCVRGRNKGEHKIQNLVSKIKFWQVWADLVNVLIGYYRKTLENIKSVLYNAKLVLDYEESVTCCKNRKNAKGECS